MADERGTDVPGTDESGDPAGDAAGDAAGGSRPAAAPRTSAVAESADGGSHRVAAGPAVEHTGAHVAESDVDRPAATAAVPVAPAPVVERPVEPAPPAERPVETPAAVDAPPARHGNRLVATFWVLFAALLFEVIYLLLIVVLIIVIDGPASLSSDLGSFFRTSALTWIPVVLFAVLYELTVLLLGRAGPFAYVVAGLVVGLLVWIGSPYLADIVQAHVVPTLAQLVPALEAPTTILAGVLARELMLWTGAAVGARGRRLRRRDRRDRHEYRARQHPDRA